MTPKNFADLNEEKKVKKTRWERSLAVWLSVGLTVVLG
jgi:hypothetical protein